MPTYLAPGIYVEEKSSGIKPLEGVSTSVAAFIGTARKGPVGVATLVTSFAEFVKRFGEPIPIVAGQQEHYLYYSVRNFFTLGGTRCYVVRVTDGSEAPATGSFAGRSAGSTTAVTALDVTALNGGEWGEALEVQVWPSTPYSLLLLADIPAEAAGSTAPLVLPDNADVRVGSLLWVVQEATGTVQSVSGTDVTFEPSMIGPADPFTIPSASDLPAYTPDLALAATTNLATDVTVTGGVPSDAVTLTSVAKRDGTPLRPGDVVNFAIRESVAVITNVTKTTVTVGPEQVPAVLAQFNPTFPMNPAGFPIARARVYGRGFDVEVRERLANGDLNLVETHEDLSLVDSDLVNHVSVRLPQDEQKSIGEGRSFYVTAEDTAANDAPLLVATPFTALAGGVDGVPPLAPAAAFEAIFVGDPVARTGLFALDDVRDVSILVVAHASPTVAAQSIAYVDGRKSMFLILEPERTATTVSAATNYVLTNTLVSQYAGIYYPWITIKDPLANRNVAVPPGGAVAGVFARTDAKRGVHKAPAGIDVGFLDVAAGTPIVLKKADNDALHAVNVNAIRNLPEGIVVWGTRTLSSDPEWKWVNVRRLFIFLEQSIERGSQWVAFEPNDSSLWQKLRRNISAFLRIQWREGKLVGDTEEQAFYVKCDEETNPPEVVDAGQVITEIGVAPSKPAEFVVFRIKQITRGGSNEERTMAEYLSPAVYIEEVPSGIKPIQAAGTSTAAFVGVAEKGPMDEAVRIDNYAKFAETFGDPLPSGFYLAFAVKAFFDEGGTTCYVVRTCRHTSGTADATTANRTFPNTDATVTELAIAASSPGSWGNDIAVSFAFSDATLDPTAADKFDIQVQYKGMEVESFNKLSTDPASDRYVVTVVDKEGKWIQVTDSNPASTMPPNVRRPAPTTTPLLLIAAPGTGGADGLANLDSTDLVGTQANAFGLHSLDEVEGVRIVAVPDAAALADGRDVHVQGLAYCGSTIRSDCFYVADPPEGANATEILNYKTAQGAYAGANALNSKYGALYTPWIDVFDPRTGGTITIPPSAAIAGRMAATDRTRGVHKAPAGTEDGRLRSALGLSIKHTFADQELLNPKGINVIRRFEGMGNLIWGARTVSSDPEWRYLNVRRQFLFLETSILQSTSWIVFEPNDRALWKSIVRNVSAFLKIQWLQGALVGATPEEAFYVKCDEETNPQESIDLGRVITEIGVAPSKPAEFVIFRISQFAAGSEVSE